MNTDMGYYERLGQFDAQEHAANTAGADASDGREEITALGVDVLRGRISETDALRRLQQLERDEARQRLYSGEARRQAVDEIRTERDQYVRSQAGRDAKRQADRERTAAHAASTQAARADARTEAVRQRAQALERQRKANADRHERDKAGADEQARIAEHRADPRNAVEHHHARRPGA